MLTKRQKGQGYARERLSGCDFCVADMVLTPALSVDHSTYNGSDSTFSWVGFDDLIKSN